MLRFRRNNVDRSNEADGDAAVTLLHLLAAPQSGSEVMSVCNSALLASAPELFHGLSSLALRPRDRDVTNARIAHAIRIGAGPRPRSAAASGLAMMPPLQCRG